MTLPKWLPFGKVAKALPTSRKSNLAALSMTGIIGFFSNAFTLVS